MLHYLMCHTTRIDQIWAIPTVQSCRFAPPGHAMALAKSAKEILERMYYPVISCGHLTIKHHDNRFTMYNHVYNK